MADRELNFKMSNVKQQSIDILQNLKLVLDKDENGESGPSINLDNSLATKKIKNITFTRHESDLIYKTIDELILNEGFEYLHFDLKRHITELACRYVISKDAELFNKFIDEYYKEPENLNVYIPIEGLEATDDVSIHQIKLRKFPIPGLEINDNGYFEGITTVAEVKVSGTDPKRMRDRALLIINYELKVLRVGLRGHNQIHDQQLRFRASKGWAIENGRIGWSDHNDTVYSLGISNQFLRDFVVEQPLYQVPFTPKTKLDRKMKLAIEWLDQSRLATDPLMRLLYDMFALETILGDKSEGLKARGLAFRRALLSTIAHGHYPDPSKVHRLYEQVRSYAVHGEEIKEFNEEDAKSFSWSVRKAVNEYLELVQANSFTRPQQVLNYLKKHDKHDELFDWLAKIDSSWEEARGKI